MLTKSNTMRFFAHLKGDKWSVPTRGSVSPECSFHTFILGLYYTLRKYYETIALHHDQPDHLVAQADSASEYGFSSVEAC